MIGTLVAVFIVLLLLGAPIAYCMGIGAYVSLAMYMPNATNAVVTKMFGGLDSFSLMAVPFFILAGNLMDSSGISRQLVDFANMLVGRIKGGLAMTAVVSGVIFAGVSGSASADTSALAAILIPPMTEEGYEKGWSSCLIGTVGMLGPIIPPSLLAILYSAATGLSVGAIFLSGVIPGIILAATLLFLSYRYATKNPVVAANQEKHKIKRTGQEIKALCISVIPALLMPLIIIGGILSGIFTATESAAVACVYAMLYGFLSKRLPFKTFWKCLTDSAEGIARLMLIVCLATLFGWILSVKNFPIIVRDAMLGLTSNKYIILLLILLLLLFIGCFMETIAALTILVPVLAPVAAAIGINDIQFAEFMIIALLVGAITPPVGINLYITTSVAKIPFTKCLKYLVPFLVVSILVTLLVMVCPPLTTLLPGLAGL